MAVYRYLSTFLGTTYPSPYCILYNFIVKYYYPIRLVPYSRPGDKLMIRINSDAGRLYFDTAQPLPTALPASTLLEVVDLDPCAPPEARKYVRTKVHVVRRANGTVGYQVVNSYAPGVSLLPLIVDGNEAYIILHDEIRYPLPSAGMESVPIEIAAAQAEGGRWSREIVSGGVTLPHETLVEAALREAREESGIVGVTPSDVRPLAPTLYSSVSTNRQPFNLFVVMITPDQWQPDLIMPDIEEGNLHVGAYNLRTAVQPMIGQQIVEMSTYAAIMSLYSVPEVRQYMW
jgi:hypothetical protein